MLINESEGKVSQYLIPVISGNIKGSANLVGFVSIPLTTFEGSTDSIKIGQKEYVVHCLSFVAEKSTRTLFCLIFPMSSNTGHDGWNGIPNFVSPSEFGIISAWACPVGNPDYQRTSIGMLELLTSSKMDRKETAQSKNAIESIPEYSLGLKVNVPYSRLEQKLSFIEFDWLTSFLRFCKSSDLSLEVKEIEAISWPLEFKTLALTDSSSSGIPNIIRIMRIRQGESKPVFIYLVRCDKANVKLTINLNLIRK